MKSNFGMVKEFMNAFGQNVKTKSDWPTDKECQLRVALIDEELQELRDSILSQDVVGVADALTDLLYVVYGAGHTFGIDLDSCFREVHRSNMSKLGGDGNPVYNEAGKVLKGPKYSPPDLGFVLTEPFMVPDIPIMPNLDVEREKRMQVRIENARAEIEMVERLMARQKKEKNNVSL